MNIKWKLQIIVVCFIFILLPSISSALKISGIVFDDKNCNGNRNLGEKGIAGVTIILNPGSLTTTTNAAGRFKFNGLTPGTYTLTEVDPSGYCSTSPNVRIVRLVFKNVSGQIFADSKKAISPPAGCCSSP
ncbi:MAG: hypothetical protein D6734_02860 [Candidatus Schekmanbacteria bacterium]|nr:MAG: hypothetical protein D6734_02860 [Candidatus Schekmanbacteria bacterium]